jgi:uncharacterized membrane protein
MNKEAAVVRTESRGSDRSVVRRINGYLHRLTPVVDATGRVIAHTVTPLMVELRPRDLMQILVGASVLAIPVGFTEETWTLGTQLGWPNIVALTAISLLFIAFYVYTNFYRYMLRDHVVDYVQRVATIYLLSLMVVGILLTVIGKCPWTTDPAVAVKRIVIVAFPASMSAAVTDTVK